MKYNSMTETVYTEDKLKADLEGAREIGSLSVGDQALYFHRMRRIYYIAYVDITRCFRRVLQVQMKLCCGGGQMPVERLVVCTDKGELTQMPLPDTRAARAVMEELGKRAPQIPQGCAPQEDKAQKEAAQSA